MSSAAVLIGILRVAEYMFLLTDQRLNKLSERYILKESIFDFRYVRLYDVDILKEKWLNYLQTVETLIRRRVLCRLICLHYLPVTRLGISNRLNLFMPYTKSDVPD